MIEGGKEDAALFDELPVLAGDLEIWPDQAHGGDAAETDDDLRLEELRLRAQKIDTGVLLGLHGVPVFGRAAFDEIRDVAVVAAKVDDREHLVEEFARRADERIALHILIAARAFADKHYVGILVAHTENYVISALAKFASAARVAFSFQFI